MTQSKVGVLANDKVKIAIVDILAITVIYFLPTLSHLLAFPLYLIEPMRIMLIFALVHTRKENAIFIAISLPLFSYLISAHPQMPKTILISFELLVNVGLFFFIKSKINNLFVTALISIIASKVLYYIAKFAFIQFALIGGSLVSTPLYIQLIVTIVLSGYIFLMFKEKQ